MHSRRRRHLRRHSHLVRLPRGRQSLRRGSDLLLSDSPRFRQVVAGWSLRLAPLLFVASALVRPEWSEDKAVLLARLAAEADAQLAAALLGLAGCVLALPAVLALMHMLRERWVALGHLAGILTLLGVMAMVFRYTVELVIWQMAQPGGRRGEMVSLLERLMDEPAILVPFTYLPLVLGAGLVALSIVLRLGEAVEPWSAYFVAVGAGLASAGLFDFDPDPTRLKIGWGLVLAGANKMGTRVLAQSRENWRHWPAWSFKWRWGK